MNEHLEILVPVKPNKGFSVLRVFLWIICVLCCFPAFLAMFGAWIGVVFALIAALSGFGAYYAGLNSDIEYEYTLTEKELDIDIIYCKERRKHLVTLDLIKMEICAPEKSHYLDSYRNRECKVKDFGSKLPENDSLRYAMYYEGEQMYILDVDERLYKAFYNIAPRKVYQY